MATSKKNIKLIEKAVTHKWDRIASGCRSFSEMHTRTSCPLYARQIAVNLEG